MFGCGIILIPAVKRETSKARSASLFFCIQCVVLGSLGRELSELASQLQTARTVECEG